ncbi:MAG TPA: hypothetical protein VFQ88_10025 [Nevskiaceae bacterium]|nr:hypothetical protein [Nevskiaceae bacterium]
MTNPLEACGGEPPDAGSPVGDPATSQSNALFVLGAADPEMNAIEALLESLAIPHMRATVRGKRVYPANAYRATAPTVALEALARGGHVYLVECVDPAPPGAVRIDHHRPGDRGYGRPPPEFWSASSLGQTVAALTGDLKLSVEVTPRMRLIAAADHCLGDAYAGHCPGVTPDALLRWHVASRAAFERRDPAAVLEDLRTTHEVLQTAPRVTLAGDLEVVDVRHQRVPELLIAAARDGQCVLSAVTTRDGRTKVGCLVGSQAQITAFMQEWAPAHGLVDLYGDPVRGFAGAYVPKI